MNKPISMQTGPSGPWARAWNAQLSASRDERSRWRSQEAKVRFGGLQAARGIVLDLFGLTSFHSIVLLSQCMLNDYFACVATFSSTSKPKKWYV